MSIAWIPTRATTEGGYLPIRTDHREYRAAATVKIHVDAAIAIAKRGDEVGALERLVTATNALRGVRSPRIERSWVTAIQRVHAAVTATFAEQAA